ncbi:PEP-CTERM/exosortase system-associated acyltransferase [Alkalimarinus alittae]|uniref:PEP-CTERM/exosortase system-associated acyltransferase n=1 Tax=Alkalimarinus alittae TaxID=2961619 RepID=A0ABY6MZ47_9ALTE|nr:PEP-CTERM/exosortase system-associated acyltransferase [Alkalimarinus alittae]UZE95032.1 PEP-CTERM/exosortase system-associated acyltransferase [Alkalimarinus alittae]
MGLAIQRNDSNNVLIQGFKQYFDIQRAESPETLRDVYRIRYGVYCKEFGFDLPSHHGQERDEFDRYSSHCLLTHKESGKKVGCIRVISLPEADKRMELPFITHCANSLYRDQIDPSTINPTEICEISRVAVVSEFRRRPGEKSSKDGLTGNLKVSNEEIEQTRRFPYIAPSLYLAAGALFLSGQKKQIFVATEPRLVKSLSMLGVRFNQVSELTEYHGKRAVYYFSRQSIKEDIEAMPTLLNGFFHYIQRQIT